MTKYYSDRVLDEAGRQIKEAKRMKEADMRRDEKKLNEARERALENAHNREKGR
jgi:predicted Holliday junction resolvase-like endonuclease